MKVLFGFLVVFLIGAACRAEVSTQKPETEAAKGDLTTAESFGIGFYAGGWPFGGYYGYGYPYRSYGYYPYKKYFGIGYPYYGMRAYPALPIWG